ncbi:MAG: hypothetical protein ABW321_35340, partial [Polyangiales bacterium]
SQPQPVDAALSGRRFGEAHGGGAGLREASGVAHRYPGDAASERGGAQASSARFELGAGSRPSGVGPSAPRPALHAASIPGTNPLDPRTTRSDGARYGAAAVLFLIFACLGIALYHWTRTSRETTRSAVQDAPATPPPAAAPSTPASPSPRPGAAPAGATQPAAPSPAAAPAPSKAPENPARAPERNTPAVPHPSVPAKPSPGAGRPGGTPKPAPRPANTSPEDDPWNDFGGRR